VSRLPHSSGAQGPRRRVQARGSRSLARGERQRERCYTTTSGSGRSPDKAGRCPQLEGDIPIVVLSRASNVFAAPCGREPTGRRSGLVIINAKTPPLSSAPVRPGDLTGPVARRVLEVLEQDVNPQIAMHGGGPRWSRSKARLPTSRCRWMPGIGMARATLSQGIAVAITDAVPEISEVVDVTDHMSGTTRTSSWPDLSPRPALDRNGLEVLAQVTGHSQDTDNYGGGVTCR